MKRVTICVWTLLVIGPASPACAVMPPTTALQSPSMVSMGPLDWLLYGSIVIVLGALLVAAVALVLRLVRSLFSGR